MKCRPFYVIALFSSCMAVSCSNDEGKDESVVTPSATSENGILTAPDVTAKEKKTDLAVQHLKGRVEIVTESVSYPGSTRKTLSKNIFKYDDNGNRLELTSKTGDRVNSTIRSIYDGNGKLIREETMLGTGAIEVISEIKTDEKGNRIEQQDTRQNSSTTLFNYKYYFKYDENGQLIERTAYRGNGTFLYRYSYKYSQTGNRTEWIQTGSDSTITARVIYKYDDKNNRIEESEYDKSNTLKANYTYRYEFDRKGNWIRQTKLQNNTPLEIRERTISYR